MEKPKTVLTVNTHEAKSRLSALLRLVEEEGLAVRICRNGKAVAELKRISTPTKNPLLLHPDLAKVVFSEDPLLPSTLEDWPEEER